MTLVLEGITSQEFMVGDISILLISIHRMQDSHQEIAHDVFNDVEISTRQRDHLEHLWNANDLGDNQ